MTITVTYPNPTMTFDFEIKGAYITNDELFLLGYHKENKQHSFLGARVNKALECQCYGTWQNTDKFYNDLLASNAPSTKIHSDISTGFWKPVEATRIELDRVLEVIKRSKTFKYITKTPSGFMS